MLLKRSSEVDPPLPGPSNFFVKNPVGASLQSTNSLKITKPHCRRKKFERRHEKSAENRVFTVVVTILNSYSYLPNLNHTIPLEVSVSFFANIENIP